MKLITQTPKDSFSDVLKKYKPVDKDFSNFKAALETFFKKNNPKESEEHYKTNLRDFLLEAFYGKDFAINTKGKQDLAVHLGKKTTNNVGAIFETKKPTNTTEMITAENPNRRALHEIVYYYFDERTKAKNFELKRLVITDFEKWFVFDSNTFDKHFYNNTEIRKLYENTVKEGKGKDYFYKSLKQIFDASTDQIPCVNFDITETKTDTQLIEIYNALSPAFLLKAEIADDSNALNKPFYNELLHIIGLEETREKNKIKIDRKPEGKRDPGSLLELAIRKIKTEYSIFPDQEKLKEYGETKDERIYNIALELCIVWVNRILFLKLLEAQLVNFHHGVTDYRFLNIKKIPTFNELYNLFHEVLAKPFDDPINGRSADFRVKYEKVPYLNSSLFDFADIERLTIRISAIDDNVTLDYTPRTALDNLKQKDVKLNTLEYLFLFLDRHDFSSVEKDELLRREDRPIINASVLGKIFEKINGYKDGSIYTPGFITMYMCRQAIRAGVVEKFNDAHGWNVETFAGLKNKIADYNEPHKILEFNETLNTIKICDPAVGSGHFLVSALNEIIAIKHELGILADADGVRLRGYDIKIVGDELDITDAENKPFKYEITNGRPNNEAQRFQKTLFHEKQTLIENCLFGVDINPNSVKICRLRLWIELLKNAYYKCGSTHGVSAPSNESNREKESRPYSVRASAEYTELETLPNIDINIKQGNSLISRFALDADLRDALKTIKYSVEDYRRKVFQYKNERDRDTKRKLLAVIEQIKADFQTEIYKHHPKMQELLKLERQLFQIQSPQLFDKYSEGERETRIRVLNAKIEKVRQEIEEIKSNKIYQNAFEWRFEFPEVLRDNGDYQGFDIVIGNPPYIRQEELGDLKDYLKPNYEVFTGTSDILVYFYELAFRIADENAKVSLITSNKFMRAGYGKPLREYLGQFRVNEVIDFGDAPVFGGIAAYASIVNLEKQNDLGRHRTRVYTFPVDETVSEFEESYNRDGFEIEQTELKTDGWRLENPDVLNLLAKLRKKGKPLGEYVNGKFYRGIITGLNEAFVIDGETRERLIAEDEKSAELIKPFLAGRDIKRYATPNAERYLIFMPKGWTKYQLAKDYAEMMFQTDALTMADKGTPEEATVRNKIIERAKNRRVHPDIAEAWLEVEYSAIYKHLKPFAETAQKRYDKGDFWWELRACEYYDEFKNWKIIYPNICDMNEFAWDEEGFLTNQKTYIIPDSNKFLLGYLNSKIVLWLFDKLLTKLLNGYFEPSKIFMTNLPIPEISPDEQKPFIELVDEILELKKAGAETDDLEREIDRMVYELYDLTTEEIEIIEGGG